ncbi:MAG: Ig-like domain repeat protein [Acidobacteriaceae bacterium]
MRFRSLFCVLLCVASASKVLEAQQPADPTAPTRLVTQAVDNAVRVTLRHNVHPLARPEFDRGEAPSGLPLGRMLMVLKRSPEQEAALDNLLEHQQDVSSPSYHQWLTPQQFGERFGPSSADIAQVTQWLDSSGFQVTHISASHLFIEFSGNADQVRQAFSTPIHRFVVNGQQHYANISDPTIPAALAPVVAGIDSLNNFQKQAQNVPLGTYSQANRRLDSPSYTFGGGTDATSDYAIVPYDFATIYDLLPLWNAAPTPLNGAGQTIAIVGRSDIDPADAPALWSYFGLDGTNAPEPKLVITYNGTNPGKTADEAEADIDTQWSGSVAPGATINLVVSASTASTDGVDLSALYIVDNNLATVLSESYGACESSMGATGVQFYGSLWQQAAAQGISVFVSSGDSGAAGCDSPSAPAQGGLQVNGIASTPFNAAVGGTDFNQYQAWSTYWNSTNNAITKESAKGYIPETTWNDSCANAILQSLSGGSSSAEANCNNPVFKSFLNSTAGAGGESSSWLKPNWQTGTPNDNARDLPDVSLFASNGFLNSYYLVCQSDAYGGACNFGDFLGFGGTSISSPQFAGIMAIINQKTGSAQGIPGLKLYKLAAQQPSAFHDITAGSTIAVPCSTSTPSCTTTKTGDAYGILTGYNTATGYDLATGLGSVDIANLVNQWQSISFTSSTTALSVNGGGAVDVVHGASVPLEISVTPSAATGEAALMVAPGTPGDPGIAAFPLTSGTVATSTSLLPGGSYSVLAHYSGDSIYGGSYSNSVPITVSPETSTSFVNLITTNVTGASTSYSASSANYGTGYQYLRIDVGDAHATLSPSTGISSLCSSRKESCPTGNIVLSAPGTSLDGVSVPLNNEGFAQIPAPAPGTYAVTAKYAGDASFGASSASTSFTIAKSPDTASAGGSGGSDEYGNLESIAGSVLTTSNGVAPTGTFQFYVDGSPILAPLPVGESNGYGGVINGAPFYATADAQTLYTFLTLGSHTLSVQYSGDANYKASSSPAASFTVVQSPSDLASFGVSNPAGGSVVAGQPAVAGATVFGSQGGVAPTGTITFYSNNVVIPGTVAYSTSQTSRSLSATMPVLFATPGTYSITATYSGDTNYTSDSTPSAQPLMVLGPISITPAVGVVIATPGASGSSTFSVIPNGGFSGTATVNCTPDPAAKETTCTLVNGTNSGSTLQVNVSGAGPSLTLNLTTTGPHQLARQQPPSFTPRTPIVFAGLLAFLLPAFRRHRRYLLCIVAMALTLGLAACGGGSSGSSSGGSNTDPGTAAGTYSFAITASTGSGATAFTTVSAVSITVQ